MKGARGACVGMLDWGIGGIGCYRLLKRARPDVPVLYWSDTGAVPYGKLPARALRERVQAVLRSLIAQGATHLIVACNAASTVLPALELGVPTQGVIDQAVSTIPGAFRGTLGVVGGARTIRSGVYRRVLARPGVSIRSRIAQPLSAHVEGGTTDSAAFAEQLARTLSPLRDVDGLLLACTHYPSVLERIRVHTPHAQIFDPALALARAAARCDLPDTGAPDRFVTTGDPGAMRAAAWRAWHERLGRCQRVTLPNK